jgi:hypothetical protein
MVLADDALAVRNEMQQQIEYLGLNGNSSVSASQFSPIRV